MQCMDCERHVCPYCYTGEAANQPRHQCCTKYLLDDIVRAVDAIN